MDCKFLGNFSGKLNPSQGGAWGYTHRPSPTTPTPQAALEPPYKLHYKRYPDDFLDALEPPFSMLCGVKCNLVLDMGQITWHNAEENARRYVMIFSV
jgi:hypothetical protein